MWAIVHTSKKASEALEPQASDNTKEVLIPEHTKAKSACQVLLSNGSQKSSPLEVFLQEASIETQVMFTKVLFPKHTKVKNAHQGKQQVISNGGQKSSPQEVFLPRETMQRNK